MPRPPPKFRRKPPDPAPRERRPGNGWDPRYLIDTTPERIAREAEYGRALMHEATKWPR